MNENQKFNNTKNLMQSSNHFNNSLMDTHNKFGINTIQHNDNNLTDETNASCYFSGNLDEPMLIHNHQY